MGEEDKEEEEKKPKTKKVEKTTWDWVLCNQSKPIWTRKPDNIEQTEYDEFYKSITKDNNGPLTQSHFIAEGEVTFKSLLFIPNTQPSETFNKYGQTGENIKLYVRRVFITDDFKDMMPNYLNFAEAIETMMRKTLGVDLDEQVEEEEEITDEEPPEDDDDEEEEEEDDEEDEETEEEAPVDTKDEL